MTIPLDLNYLASPTQPQTYADVQIIANNPPAEVGKIKVLFSRIEGTTRVFYVGGDRATPKKIYSIPSKSYLSIAQISNAGDGDQYFVGLKYRSSSQDGTPSTFYTITAKTNWRVEFQPLNSNFWDMADPFYAGHGFWSQTTPNLNTYGMNTTFTSFSQYKGQSRRLLGGWESSNGSVRTTQGFNAVAPNIEKLSKTEYYNPSGNRLNIRKSQILGKNGSTAIYEHSVDNNYNSSKVQKNELVLVDCNTKAETVLGGDLGWKATFNYKISLVNLVARQLYYVNLNFPLFAVNGSTIALPIPQTSWEPTQETNLTIDVYNLGANTTKSLITAKVSGIMKDAQIHSLSYHP